MPAHGELASDRRIRSSDDAWRIQNPNNRFRAVWPDDLLLGSVVFCSQQRREARDRWAAGLGGTFEKQNGSDQKPKPPKPPKPPGKPPKPPP
jgi:hypothetical protein